MSRVIKTLGWAWLAAAVLSIAIVAAVLSSSGSWDPVVVAFDDGPSMLAEFDAGHWALTGGAVLLALIVALLVVLVVVPIAVLVPLLLVALALVGVLIVVAAAAALVFSPLVLAVGVVWLIWRLARGGGATPKAGATIAQ